VHKRNTGDLNITKIKRGVRGWGGEWKRKISLLKGLHTEWHRKTTTGLGRFVGKTTLRRNRIKANRKGEEEKTPKCRRKKKSKGSDVGKKLG